MKSKASTIWRNTTQFKNTLPPIIMEVENGVHFQMCLVSKGSIFHFHDGRKLYSTLPWSRCCFLRFASWHQAFRISGFAKCHSVRIRSSADGHQSPPGFSQARVNGENITRTPKLSLRSILSHVQSSDLCHKIKLCIYMYIHIYSQIISFIYIYIYSDTQIIQSSHYTTASMTLLVPLKGSGM